MDIKEIKNQLEYSILDLTKEIAILNNIIESKKEYREKQLNVLEIFKNVVFCKDEEDGLMFYKDNFIMDVKEINKMLNNKNLNPELKKALEKRKDILLNDKEVEK